MENEAETKTPIPTRPDSAVLHFALQSLHSQLIYLATNSSPPSHHSYQWTISLCSLPSLWLFPLCLRVLVAISQLCKTKPISKWAI